MRDTLASSIEQDLLQRQSARIKTKRLNSQEIKCIHDFEIIDPIEVTKQDQRKSKNVFYELSLKMFEPDKPKSENLSESSQSILIVNSRSSLTQSSQTLHHPIWNVTQQDSISNNDNSLAQNNAIKDWLDDSSSSNN